MGCVEVQRHYSGNAEQALGAARHNASAPRNPEDSKALADLAQRGAALQCIVQDGQIWLGDGDQMLQPVCHVLKDVN